MRRNNRSEREFLLFTATWRDPLPLVRLSRQKYAKPCTPTVEKLGRLIGQSPNLTWWGPGGRNMPKKKEKKRRGERKKKYESLLAGTAGVRTSGWQCASPERVEKELTARSKSEFLDEGGSLEFEHVCRRSTSSSRHDRHRRNSRIESAITRSTNCVKLVDSRNRSKTM